MKTPKKVAQAIEVSGSAIMSAAETAGDTLGRAIQAAQAAIDSPLVQKGRKSASTLRKRVTAMVTKARKKAKPATKKAAPRKKTAVAKRAASKKRPATKARKASRAGKATKRR